MGDVVRYFVLKSDLLKNPLIIELGAIPKKTGYEMYGKAKEIPLERVVLASDYDALREKLAAVVGALENSNGLLEASWVTDLDSEGAVTQQLGENKAALAKAKEA